MDGDHIAERFKGCGGKAVEGTNGEVHVNQPGFEKLTDLEGFIVEFAFNANGSRGINQNLVIREEDEMLNQYLGGLAKGILGGD